MFIKLMKELEEQEKLKNTSNTIMKSPAFLLYDCRVWFWFVQFDKNKLAGTSTTLQSCHGIRNQKPNKQIERWLNRNLIRAQAV